MKLLELTDELSRNELIFRQFMLKMNQYAPGKFKREGDEYTSVGKVGDYEEALHVTRVRSLDRDLRYHVKAIYRDGSDSPLSKMHTWVWLGTKNPPLDKGSFANMSTRAKHFGSGPVPTEPAIHTFTFEYFPNLNSSGTK